jgi:hypothetical protein
MNTLDEVRLMYPLLSADDRNRVVYTVFESAARKDAELARAFELCEGFGEMAFAWNWKLLVDAMPASFKFLEVGVYKGRVLGLVGLCAERERRLVSLHGVTPLCNIGDKYSRYDESNYFGDVYGALAKCGVPANRLKLHIGLSQDPAILRDVREDGPYDCIFIDGCHDYEVVVADIKAYLPLVKVGGYFVMDDSSLYIEKPYGQFLGHPDVSRAAKEYLTEAAGVRHIVAVGHNQVWQRVA